MKILILIGSARKHGNTAQAIDLLREELERLAPQGELETETIFLADLEIQACRGCRGCFDRGEARCPNHDDLPALREKMRAAEGLVVASPVYVDDVSGLTKTWIDRTAYACHRPEFAGKCAVTLTTTGGTPTGHAARTLAVALNTWGYNLVAQAGLVCGALMKPEETRARHQAGLRKLAGNLYQALSSGVAARPSFVSLMTFRIQQLSWQKVVEKDSLDYRYWQANGWLERGVSFFIPHQSPGWKVLAARLVGGLVARLFA